MTSFGLRHETTAREARSSRRPLDDSRPTGLLRSAVTLLWLRRSPVAALAGVEPLRELPRRSAAARQSSVPTLRRLHRDRLLALPRVRPPAFGLRPAHRRLALRIADRRSPAGPQVRTTRVSGSPDRSRGPCRVPYRAQGTRSRDGCTPHWRRRFERGFNQAALIARPLAKALDLPFRTLLRRTRATTPQSGLHSDERRRNVRGCFQPTWIRAPGIALAGACVVLVDDVATPGTTLDEASRVLKAEGAARVTAVAAARTPLTSG